MPPNEAAIIVTMRKQGELQQKVELLADFKKRVFVKRVWCQNLVRLGDDNTSFSSVDLVGRTLSWDAGTVTPLKWSLTSLFMRFSYDYGFLQRVSEPETPPVGRLISLEGARSVKVLPKHVGLADVGLDVAP